jgi:hypothetical protein
MAKIGTLTGPKNMGPLVTDGAFEQLCKLKRDNA